MGKYILKRIALAAVILFLSMFLIYAVMRLLPNSFAEEQARRLSQSPGAKSFDEWLAQLNALYGFDKNVFEGFFIWLGKAVKGDFGDSWLYTVPVTQQFKKVIWNSFALGAFAMIFQFAIAIPLGIIAARKQYKPADYGITVVSLIGISLPTFFAATLLKLLFSIKLGWFDLYGMVSGGYTSMSPAEQFFDKAAHFVLPTLTLIVVGIGGLMRMTRTNMLEVLSADYIRTARAKGLKERRVVNRHAFRNTLVPLVTATSGVLPSLFGGALITETLFQIDGIGYTSYKAIVGGDIPFTMFYLSLMAVLILVSVIIADIMYVVVDPRVKFAK